MMALTVWAVQRPDYLVSMTLSSQFTADMVNISVVNTDEYYGKTRFIPTFVPRHFPLTGLWKYHARLVRPGLISFRTS